MWKLRILFSVTLPLTLSLKRYFFFFDIIKTDVFFILLVFSLKKEIEQVEPSKTHSFTRFMFDISMMLSAVRGEIDELTKYFQVMFTRMDNILSVTRPDGTRIVDHIDGTRITTVTNPDGK